MLLVAYCRVRVANKLGAGSSESVKFATIVVTIESPMVGIIFFVALLIFGGSLVFVFTNSLEVAEAVADLSPLFACSILMNSVHPVLSGVSVGAGWQHVVFFVLTEAHPQAISALQCQGMHVCLVTIISGYGNWNLDFHYLHFANLHSLDWFR